MGVGGFSRYENRPNGKRTLDFLKYFQHGSTVNMDILSSFVHVSCLPPAPPPPPCASTLKVISTTVRQEVWFPSDLVVYCCSCKGVGGLSWHERRRASSACGEWCVCLTVFVNGFDDCLPSHSLAARQAVGKGQNRGSAVLLLFCLGGTTHLPQTFGLSIPRPRLA